ncbi:MAG: EamA family transporter [Bradyrhizobium sp.]|uniref:EamA family transporter n=1 Tax=Bradyrhizobium sp. TaxID=376 RepID=UPI003D0D0BEF
MTNVANVAVIVAAQPFIAAGLAWLWFREAARWRTLLASLVAFIGVAVTVSQSSASSDLRGIALAFVMVFSFSLMTTLFVLGARFLPSGEASLIATLETPLMVFWIWVAFAEVPATHALLGGAQVIGAVVADIVGEIRERSQSRQPLTCPSSPSSRAG